MSDPKQRPSDDAWEALASAELSREDEAVLRALAESDEGDAERVAAYTPLDDAFRARVTDMVGAQLEADRRRRFRARTMAVSSVLAVAAAALLVLLPSRPEALPSYAALLEGTVALQRGTSTSSTSTFVPTSQLTLTLTPQAAVQAELDVRAYLSRAGHEEPWRVPIERAPSGALRIQGRASDLLGDRFGDYRVRIEIRRAGDTAIAQELTLPFRYQRAGP